MSPGAGPVGASDALTAGEWFGLNIGVGVEVLPAGGLGRVFGGEATGGGGNAVGAGLGAELESTLCDFCFKNAAIEALVIFAPAEPDANSFGIEDDKSIWLFFDDGRIELLAKELNDVVTSSDAFHFEGRGDSSIDCEKRAFFGVRSTMVRIRLPLLPGRFSRTGPPMLSVHQLRPALEIWHIAREREIRDRSPGG
jgi:hypothetical protein